MTVKLILGDCLEKMKDFEAESLDLTITSPPYDNLRDYKGYSFNFEGIAKELYRLTKQGGVVVWVVGDQTIDGSETGTSFKQALYFKELGFNLHDTMIYEKNGSAYPEQTRYYQCFEYMFVFSKGNPKTINLIKDRENKWEGSFGKRSQRLADGTLQKKEAIKCERYGVRFNFWRINGGYGYTTKDEYAYEHPAMFPEKLAQDHIMSWSNKSDTILDPMMGSGTVGKMAVIQNRNFIGIEISEEYMNIAKKRITEEENKLKLF
jgi:site-specific DNA-methyltransferase (adenine-specific)